MDSPGLSFLAWVAPARYLSACVQMLLYQAQHRARLVVLRQLGHPLREQSIALVQIGNSLRPANDLTHVAFAGQGM